MSNPVVPRDIVAKIQFYEDREPTWTTRATQIGTTAAEVTALGVKSAAARAAYDAQQAARIALKDATLNLHLAVDAMGTAGADIIKKVRAKAATDGNGIYALASLPAPAAPSPIGQPGTPSNFEVALDQNGVLTLTWKCGNPAGATGTVYQVARKLGPAGPLAGYAVVGTSGEKKYVDPALPMGGGGTDGGQVTYQVTAIRSTIRGTPAVFTVQFGAAAGGAGFTASVVSAPKLAA